MEKYDAIVVGCGISGLLAGLALAKEGKSVLMLEKEDKVGGACRSYDVDGFVVDTGPHVITGRGNGPTQLLIDKYFDVVPKFIESRKYFLRFDGKLYAFPWTIPAWLSFPPFSVEDRLIIVQVMFKLLADYASGKGLGDKVVSDYTAGHELSGRALQFIDCMCLFLTGVCMEETPVSRILSGGRSKNKTKAEKIKEILVENGKTHYYPRGGIQTIVNSVLQSLPKNAGIHKSEEATKIVVSGGRVSGVATDKGEYATKVVVYAGPNKLLPGLVELPQEYIQKFRGLKQARTLTLWLGLNKKYFAEVGTELWTETKKPCWAVPTSNFDSALAPTGKHLVGFGFVLAEDEQVTDDNIDDYVKVVEEVFPGIREHIEMTHYQVLVAEQAANAKDNFFSGVKLPVDGLYAVGTDVDRRSMGVTRAAYSVVSLIEALKQGGFVTKV
ncbi:MAG: NAD(P)/FAD-dependent oxidoreductase [Candidatus Diapherotrites archaeon]|nr:NAD(P)/FAD-dependent oxidoreductase [Candidatus Diapherotrites archaeon]